MIATALKEAGSPSANPFANVNADVDLAILCEAANDRLANI